MKHPQTAEQFSLRVPVPLSDWFSRKGRSSNGAFQLFSLVALTPLTLLPGDMLAACQPHDPVTVAACCNENIFVGGWIYGPSSIFFTQH